MALMEPMELWDLLDLEVTWVPKGQGATKGKREPLVKQVQLEREDIKVTKVSIRGISTETESLILSD